ncbi:MAG TPA: calcium/sodium antiporter [Vicinamibacteria bacterium]|nr:calcium/sodium antiporter [Vicinamibacteria bacterium]
MNVVTASLLSLLGLVLLSFGADRLVRSSSRLAMQLGVSPLVVGLTLVAYGTSAPEIVASVIATLEGHADVAIGNILGSNVANLGLILGSTAILATVLVAPAVLRRELPLMVGVTLLFALLCFRLELGRTTGLLFLGLLVGINYFSFRWAERTGPSGVERPAGSLAMNLLWIVLGLGLLLGGAHLLVSSAVRLARTLEVPELVIGITVVAVGTSVPEFATSIVAGLRKEADLVVGNIVGSNLFNVLGALGLSAAIRPIQVDSSLLGFEVPALVAMTLLTTVFLYTGRRLVRWEGIVLFACYVGFLAVVL